MSRSIDGQAAAAVVTLCRRSEDRKENSHACVLSKLTLDGIAKKNRWQSRSSARFLRTWTPKQVCIFSVKC